MTDIYTENLADFGLSELEQLRDILTAWLDAGLPDDFSSYAVKPAFNRNSGYVFLVNDDYQVAMLKGESLEIYHSLPYSGVEGFLADITQENMPQTLHADDVEYILQVGRSQQGKMPELWQSLFDDV